MLPNKQGIYPDWMSENLVIDQMLNDIFSNNGKVLYTYFINDIHSPATNERLKKIIEDLRKKKLLMPVHQETEDIELSIEGRAAVKVGYKNYKKKHLWGRIFKK